MVAREAADSREASPPTEQIPNRAGKYPLWREGPEGIREQGFRGCLVQVLKPLENAHVPENSLSNCYSATTRINTSQNSDFESATGSSCSTSQNTQIACKDAPCSSVALSKAESGSMRQTGEEEDF